MIGLLVAIVILWTLLAFAVGTVFGKAIALADERVSQ